MFKNTTVIFLIFLSFLIEAIGFDPHEASLIVSYQVEDPTFYLDRISFSLTNENNERKIYPNEEDYLDHIHLKNNERTVAIRHLAPGHYTLQFIVPNRNNQFEIPVARTLLITENSMIKINQKIKLREHQNNFLLVSAGEAIVGDPFSDNPQNVRPPKKIYLSEFSIHPFEVTNQEYATWLNRALHRGMVQLHPSKPGVIINKEGQLICRTDKANPLSQIIEETKEDQTLFIPAKEKELHPVIEVSWYGAQYYCVDHGYRLPTESEWEKAAGMAMTNSSNALKRYKFGFGQDEINSSWANYRSSDTAPPEKRVFTSSVGFYNGINKINETPTHDAKSPYGAYDMSGNVWEWVYSMDDLNPSSGNRVVKGGCYDSFADGVRVSERLALPPDYADIYTGFRVAR